MSLYFHYVEVYDSNYIRVSYDNVIVNFVKYVDSKSSAAALQSMHMLLFKDKCEQQIYQLLLSHLLKAESIAPGGFEGFLTFLKKVNVKTNSNILNKPILDSLIKTFSPTDHDLLKDCFELAGLKGKLILSQHPVSGEVDIIEANTGCFFSNLISTFELKATKFLNAKLICIDGFIESVSEINRVLEDAASSKETIVLFVRGLSEEVNHTLKINYDRGSICVIPVIVKYDLKDVNTLVDISVCNNSDVISFLKGEIINNISIANYERISSIDITKDGILIENDVAAPRLDLHIRNLQIKSLESDNQYEKDSLTNRIQNLGISRLTIRLRDSKNKKERSLMIDRAIRAVKSSMTYGVCEIEGKIYPHAGITAGIFYANNFISAIKSLGSIVV